MARIEYEPITLPMTEALSQMLKGRIEYLTDEETWEEVTLAGFHTFALRTQAFSMVGPCIEVLPLPETDFGKQWYADHQPPLPIKVYRANRLRAKEMDAEPLPLMVIEA